MPLVYPAIVLSLALVLSWPTGWYLCWALHPDQPGPRRRAFDGVFRAVVGSCPEQSWRGYVVSMLVFNAWMFAIAFLVLSYQHRLPLNPDGRSGLEWSLAFNTAASFTTNTNLQHYAGEQHLSYGSQIVAVMWLQFGSAATGMAAAVALCRALAGRPTVGNFYLDLGRATALVLIPLSLALAALLIVAGVPMTLEGAAQAHTVEGVAQRIARGPVAAVVAIKQLGTNGGGYFGANSTHPFENPSAWTNLLENLAMLLIPMGTVWMFGRITRRLRHAAVVFGVMLAGLLCLLALAIASDGAAAPGLRGLPVTNTRNLEGKELRFGPHAGALWAVCTTCTSNGSVNAMLDSLMPLAVLAPLIALWVNAFFGGVGVGLLNMVLFIVLAVFLAGLMVGRTPEYLARKIEAREMVLVATALLAHPLFILGGTATFCAMPWGAETVAEPGAHGFSEIVYEFSSSAANNGSGLEGLSDNTVPWNVATGAIMLLARFVPILAPLALAGLMSAKRAVPETPGTFRVDTLLFAVVLAGTLLITTALLFLPLAVLGPIAEHLGRCSVR